MNKTSLIVLATAVASLSHAGTFSVVNSLDTFVNSSAANVNKAYGANFAITSNATTSDFYKFSGTSFPSDVNGSTLSSLTLSYFPTVIDPNTTVQFYFSSNAAWQEYTGSGSLNGVNQADAQTTPYLVFNNSGLAGAASSRFLANSALLGSVTYATSAGALNTAQSITLSLDPALSSALTSGESFTIYSVATSGRMSVITDEGAVATGHPTGAFPVTLNGNYQAVPEPASFAALGLGAVAVLRRRRK